jgi:hypothetical protein
MKMAHHIIEVSQRKAARVAGFMYLFLLPSALFAEFCVRSNVIVFDDVPGTVSKIMASEGLYRISIVCDLITFAGTVVLITALYVLLKPVNEGLALLASFWRLVECAILGAITVASLIVLLLFSRREYSQVFGVDQLRSLATLSIDAHRAGFRFAGIFFGLGSAVSSYLLFKSQYVPRVLAALGMFASLLVLAFMFAFILFPPFLATGRLWTSNLVVIAFELTMGLWLLVKGVTDPEVAEPGKLQRSHF